MMPETSIPPAMETLAPGTMAVCPSEETLRVGSQTNVKCGVAGCERIFAQMSARRFHMVKVHKIIETDQDAVLLHRGAGEKQDPGDVRYHCPVPKCKYTLRLGRFFTSMKNLNQHYRHVHAEKKYKCSRCGHGFGELRGQVRHEKSCGLKFVCQQCSNIYNTKDALQTHCSRTGHRSGFSAINNLVFHEAGSGAAVATHPLATNSATISTSATSTKAPSLITTTIPQCQRVPGTPQLTINAAIAKTGPSIADSAKTAALTANSANTTPSASEVQIPESEQHQVTKISNEELVREQSVNIESGLSTALNNMAGTSEAPHQDLGTDQEINRSEHNLSLEQSATAETILVELPQQQLPAAGGQSQPSSVTSSLTVNHHDEGPASSQQQEILVQEISPSKQIPEVCYQQVAKLASSHLQQGSATLEHYDVLPDSSQQQEISLSPQISDFSDQQASSQLQLGCATLNHTVSVAASTQDQGLKRSEKDLEIPVQEATSKEAGHQEKNTSLQDHHPSAPSLSLGQEIHVENHHRPEEASKSATPGSLIPSGPTYILPKPDALYMPVQLQINRENVICGGQSGPVILIINNTAAPEPPKRLKPLAPKVSKGNGFRARTRSVQRNERCGVVVGMAREMEVQTEESQRYPEVVSTSSLSVQTMPCSMFVDTTSGDLTQKVAETQTIYNPQFVVETQSKSSQVSPNTKLRRPMTQDGCTGMTSKNSTQKNKQKRRKQAKGDFNAGSLTPVDDVGIIPKKQRRRQKVGGTSSKDCQKQNPSQSSLSIVEAVGTHNVYSNASECVPLLNQSDGMLSVHRVSAAVGTAPELQFESVGVGTMSSPLSLSDLSIPEQPLMVSVSTDMSRANTSVGTMPSPPLTESYSNHFTPVSMNTIGTDPLPSFSGSSKDLSLSAVFSQETQTSFWAEFQASIAESNATQTMESYLADGDPLNMPSLMESAVQTCHAQNSQTQTWPVTDTVSVGVGTSLFNQPHSPALSQTQTWSTADTVSVGVGTSLLNQPHSPTLFEGMENDGLSRSIGIDTQLFDDLFPEVSSRSVAISTPLLDGMDNSRQSPGMENVMFRPIGQSRSVGVSPLGHNDLGDLDCLSRSNEGQTAASSQTTFGEGQYECIATASVQTDTDFELPIFLTAASQTSTYDPSLTHMETQTVDMFSQLLSNMETQTSTDILTELNFADIETQTMSPGQAPAQASTSVETQTAPTLSATGDGDTAAATSEGRMSVYIDTETQTRLPNLHLTENSLTDSHTQTTVEQFASLVDELEKS